MDHLSESVVTAFRLLVTGDAALWNIVWVSLSTTVVSLALATPPSIALAYWVAYTRFAGKRLVVVAIQSSLAVPTVVIGLFVYLLLSRRGPAGALGWLFSPMGLIVGQILIALPVLAALALSAFQALDPRLRETAITLGAGRRRLAWTLMREARFGLLATLVNGFGRVIAEVGCALMVGGNIADYTRTMTTAIALETSKGEFAQGIALGFVLLAVALLMNAIFALAQGRGGLR